MSGHCFFKDNVVLKVALAPSQSNEPSAAVKNQLNSLLFKYCEELQGVPVAYSKPTFPRQYGRILAEHPWIHVDAETQLLVFKPRIGKTLKGKVIKVTDSHISALVYNMFNASVSASELRKKFSFNVSSQTWEGPSGDISEGDSVALQVSSHSHSNGILHIDGII